MTIALTCPGCGKAYRVADQLAGRQGKCRDCGSMFPIPKPAPVPPPPPPPAPAPELGYEVVDDEDPAPPRPRQRSTEEDGAVMSTPRRQFSVSEEEDEAPPPRRRAADVEDDDEAPRPRRRASDDEDDVFPRPRRRPTRSWTPVIIGASVLVVLLVGVGVTYWSGILPFFGGSSPLEKDLLYLPDNCEILIHVNNERILASEAYQKINAEFVKAGLDFEKKLKEANLGITTADISRVSIGGDLTNFEKTSVAVVTTKKAFSAADIKKIMVAMSTPPAAFKEEKVGRYQLHESTDGKGAYCSINEYTHLIGEPAPLRSILQRDKSAQVTAGMKSALKQLNSGKLALGLAIDGQGIRAAKKNVPANPAMTAYTKRLDDLEAFTLQLDLTSSVDLRLTGLCKDSASADQAKKDLNDVVSTMRVGVNTMPNSPKELLKVVEAIQVTSSGSKAIMSLSVDAETLINLSKGYRNMIPGGGFGVPIQPQPPKPVRPPTPVRPPFRPK